MIDKDLFRLGGEIWQVFNERFDSSSIMYFLYILLQVEYDLYMYVYIFKWNMVY